MKLIIGLGNPGEKFKKTRHNAGAFIVEGWLKNQNFNNLILKKKLEAKISLNPDLAAAIPEVYMNESGRAIRKIMKEFKIKPADLLIIHDDADLTTGNYKLQLNRGAAGHRGIQSVIDLLKTKNFWRLRIGVRPAINKLRQKAEIFILKKFAPSEFETLKKTLPDFEAKINEWLKK